MRKDETLATPHSVCKLYPEEGKSALRAVFAPPACSSSLLSSRSPFPARLASRRCEVHLAVHFDSQGVHDC